MPKYHYLPKKNFWDPPNLRRILIDEKTYNVMIYHTGPFGTPEQWKRLYLAADISTFYPDYKKIYGKVIKLPEEINGEYFDSSKDMENLIETYGHLVLPT